MTQPSFPVATPPLSRDDVLNLIITSIAMEQLGYSHVINAEGEKLQYVLGTSSEPIGETPTLDQILEINESIQDVLANAAQSQMFLQSKLQMAVDAPAVLGAVGATGPTGPTGPAQGAPGAPGNTGPVGTPGLPGPTGATGAQGAAGPQGTVGPRGAQGAPGAVGATGPTGPTGTQGPSGATGPEGEPGPLGSRGPAGATGPTGATGITGTTGEPGPEGPQGQMGEAGGIGPPGPDLSRTAAFVANTTGPNISTLLGPALVALPSAQVLSPDITANGANTVFTVGIAGTYRISYQLNATAALLLGTQLLINGSAVTESIIPPALGVSAFKNEITTTLSAGSTISLQLFGAAGIAVLLSNALGAALMVIRLE
ncbi:MAG: collagen-like protein [Firmicutes bacterium]|nr:collagen-like protein [Bacillota bacterium]